MNPIIDPKWFYLIEISNKIGPVAWGIGVIIVLGSVFLMILLVLGQASSSEDELMLSGMFKRTKTIFIIGAIVACIGCFCPSENTCYKMIVASYLTPNNISIAQGETEKLIDYIVRKINELNNTEESD